MDRRTFLRRSVGVAAAVVLPLPVTTSPRSSDKLASEADRLARTAETMAPLDAARAASSHFRVVEAALIAAPTAHQRQSLHRTAAVDALTAARATRWCGQDGTSYLVVAEDHARAVGERPLLARVWLERAAAEGATALAVDAPSPRALTLVVAALDAAGTGEQQSHLRASARYRLAWECAAEGDAHSALLELDAATLEAEAVNSPPWWIAARSGTTLRRLGRCAQAEAVLSRGLAGPPVRATAALCDLARVYAVQGDADAAAASLEDAYLLGRAHGIACREQRILAVRQCLPECSAVRQLDAVMYAR